MAEITNVLEILRTNKFIAISDLFVKYRELVPLNLPKSKLKEILLNVCHVLELTEGEDEYNLIESFKQIHKNLWKHKTLEEFSKILLSWININKLEFVPVQRVKRDYMNYLKKLKKYYEKVVKTSCDQDKTIIFAAISKINSKLALFSKLYYYESPILSFREELLSSEKGILQEIFDFYANSHLIISKYTTFDGLKIQKMLWSCGVFIKFCNTFQLSTRICKLKPSISHKALITIFTKHSLLKKSLDFTGFLNSLDDLGSEYYKIPENLSFPINLNTLTPTICKTALLDTKKVLNIQKIRQLLKMSVKSFASTDTKPRIAINDPCLAYKFVASPRVHNKLKQIKLEKQKQQKKKMTVPLLTDPTVRVRTRPMSSYLSVQNLKKSADVVRVYSHTKSKGSLSDEIIIENC